jgi:hypothetical protein
VERIDQATLPLLQQKLRQNVYHIFHFIGHGTVDDDTQQGALLFENDDGSGQLVDSRLLNTLLYDEKTLRLVVLNACQGGQTWAKNPFGGVAQGLVQQSIPAVVAMQFPVTDAAAIAFSQGFYGALADFSPVDMAISEARKAMFFAGSAVEWGTPVLYLRAADAQIFSPTNAGTPSQGVTPAPIPAAAPAQPTAAPATSLPQPIAAAVVGRWTYDSDKKRLSLNGKFVDYTDRYAITPYLDRGDGSFFKGKDSKGVGFSLMKITKEFLPVGKWTIEYDWDGPAELEIEFQSTGEFTAVENYKKSKRWVSDALDGQWAYDVEKKRLSINGKYSEDNARFSITPYILQWDRDQFTAKDHEGKEFFLRRVG